jgi:hypothetical protein
MVSVAAVMATTMAVIVNVIVAARAPVHASRRQR